MCNNLSTQSQSIKCLIKKGESFLKWPIKGEKRFTKRTGIIMWKGERSALRFLFECIGLYDYSGYDMRAIIDNHWSRCHITTGAITFDEYIFEPISSDKKMFKNEGCFFWPEAKHISE